MLTDRQSDMHLGSSQTGKYQGNMMVPPNFGGEVKTDPGNSRTQSVTFANVNEFDPNANIPMPKIDK